eukprot:symbB.v1.2.014826.t1/scaffold1093.1/size138456/8
MRYSDMSSALEKALDLAQVLGDNVTEASLNISFAQAQMGLLEISQVAPGTADFRDSGEAATKAAKKAVALARRGQRSDLIISALCALSQTQFLVGEKQAARSAAKAATSLAKGQPLSQATALVLAANSCITLGKMEAAKEAAGNEKPSHNETRIPNSHFLVVSGCFCDFVMNLHHEAVPANQSKRRRIDGNGGASSAVGEGLIELEVLSISGECMLTLNVADSMLGRELWEMILDKIPSKPGLQLVVSHTSRLVLHESLQQQGLGGQRAQVSATYIPVNLHAAWRWAHGHKVEDKKFSLNGIAQLAGVDWELPAFLSYLPKSLRTLTFSKRFNEKIHHMRLPAGLHTLTFGANFNQSLDNVTWPAGLRSVTFGEFFNQSLDNVTWPTGLQTLTFGPSFNQSLDNVAWPAGLQSLTFGWSFNQSLDNVTWPTGLQTLTFGPSFNQSLDNVAWPAGLQSLIFEQHVNQSLDNVTWPAGLRSLNFGQSFNQSLDNVTLPEGLQSLTFGWSFNQSLDNVTWPTGLQTLTFGQSFNQSLDNVTWPEGLQSLTFGARFNQSLDNVAWPAGLQSLIFVNQNLTSLQVFDALPRALRHLQIGEISLKC